MYGRKHIFVRWGERHEYYLPMLSHLIAHNSKEFFSHISWACIMLDKRVISDFYVE